MPNLGPLPDDGSTGFKAWIVNLYNFFNAVLVKGKSFFQRGYLFFRRMRLEHRDMRLLDQVIGREFDNKFADALIVLINRQRAKPPTNTSSQGSRDKISQDGNKKWIHFSIPPDRSKVILTEEGDKVNVKHVVML